MYVSDLTHLDEQERWLLFETLLKLPPSAASEREWNEALGYIEHLPAQHSAEEARKRLMKALCEGQGKHSTEKNEQEEKG